MVTDWSGMRISFFSPEGDFIESFRRQKFSGQVAISRENRIYIHEQPRTLGAMGMFVGGMEEDRILQTWALDLYDRAGRWLARQQMDESSKHALLDWGPDGLYLISSEGDGTVRRYSVKPPD